MNEDLILNWNGLVNPEDRVYLLGDVAFTPKHMQEFIPRLKGRICLVPGNHEPPKMRKYFNLFDDVRGYVQRKGFIMSHIPLHPDCLGRWEVNIHGHLHNNTVKIIKFNNGNPIEVDDPRYENVSVERIDYRPILLDLILEKHGLKNNT
jgi:calcineurin-like phosphoesterase family protein